MVAPFEPYSYRSPLVNRITPMREVYNSVVFESLGSLPVIHGSTDRSWREAKIVLCGVMTLAEQGEGAFGIPARVELFHDASRWERGVAIFDDGGELIVHIMNAVITRSGLQDWYPQLPRYVAYNSTTQLTYQVLRYLGISGEVFDEIRSAVERDNTYMVVVSRQRHETINGVEVASAGAVEPEWEWWRIR